MVVIAPELAIDPGLTPKQLGLLGGAYFVLFALLTIPIGVLIDCIGPRRLVLLRNHFLIPELKARHPGIALIEKARNTDTTRSHLLTLCAHGRETLTAVYAVWAEMDRLLETLLGEAKARRLAELTRELRDALGGRPPGPVTGD